MAYHPGFPDAPDGPMWQAHLKTPVICPQCFWRGTIADTNPQMNDLCYCPKCRKPVETLEDHPLFD